MSREMKDSGVQWIGDIPKEWEIIKLGRLGKFSSSGIDKKIEENQPKVRIINYTDVYGNKKLILEEKDYMVVTCPEYKIHDHKVNVGDLIFTPSSETIEDIGVSALVNEYLDNTAFSYHVLRYKFNTEVVHNYKKYLCNNQYVQNYFSSRATGSIRKTLNREDFNSCIVFLPTIDEQQQIANYLDKKVSQIDDIISKQKSLIQKYKAYKQSLITETVTKGLNKNVPMKDSGIEWIGEIPSHWNLVKLKFIFTIKKEIANKLGYNILSVTQSGLKIKDISNNEGQISADYSKYQLVDIDDFVMNHMDLLTGFVDCSKFKGVTSPDYRVFKFINKSENSKRYYNYIFQSCYKNKIFYGLGQGVSNLGRWRLQTDKFMNFILPMCSLQEQKEIADFLDKKCNAIDSAISKKEQLILKLEDYKKSLIYECVTGKREVN